MEAWRVGVVEEGEKVMYYVKIPLRNLCEPEELAVPKRNQQELWSNRVKGLLQDLRAGVIPQWAVSVVDMNALTLLRDDDDGQVRTATTEDTGERGEVNHGR